ncbi:PEP/pyruvate-binding domain-containing protein [Nocardia sp. R16R-3T]
MARNPWVATLESTSLDTDLVGGKAAGLGRLVRQGLPVPPGFVVTSEAYRSATAGLEDRLAAALRESGPEQVAEQAQSILAEDGILDGELALQIRAAYAALGDDVPVAVRSSATSDDSEDASFAGQQDTYLWIVGADQVLSHVQRCWASLFTARAVEYRTRTGQDGSGELPAMAVVVQEMVPAAASGVLMTLNPANGDRSVVYLESAFGLGEAIVRGEIEPDTYTLAKNDLGLTAHSVGNKAIEYRFDPTAGAVVPVSVEGDRRSEPSLDAGTARRLAEVALAVEEAFGRPMDIEWAVREKGEVALLQARPETVWARRAAPVAVTDPIHSDSGVDGSHWTTANVGEAMPGVQTPLSWTIWRGTVDRGMREGAYALGAFSAAERDADDEMLVDIFFGRVAERVSFLGLLGDRIPGTTGAEIITAYLGGVPEDLVSAPTNRRLPIIAWRLPRSFRRQAKAVRLFADEQNRWWSEQINGLSALDLAGARRALAHAVRRHSDAVAMQCVSTLVAIQPAYDALASVAKIRPGTDLSTLSAVPGGPEMDVIADIWRASRGELTVADVIARHGFHGPREGEASSRVWREDPSPLAELVRRYAEQDDSSSPIADMAARRSARAEYEKEFVRGLPRAARPLARGVLALVRARLPLRGLAKRSMLQSLDAARGAARRIGEHLVEQDVLREVDDVCFLTVEELTGELPEQVAAVVAARRATHRRYAELAVPDAWSGTPEALPRAEMSAAEGDVLTGVGVSAGVVEGIARVLEHPDPSAIAEGEILVAPVTDPAWCGAMFLASGLVVDVGGALSHAAVVARELGQPCVVNTRTGTARIRSGDRIRVDGDLGQVTVVARAELDETASIPEPDLLATE